MIIFVYTYSISNQQLLTNLNFDPIADKILNLYFYILYIKSMVVVKLEV